MLQLCNPASHCVSCSTDPLPALFKMSPLLLPERRVYLWDDWWTNRQNKPLSVLRDVWSKIRSSIKTALWNLSALCQWSACSAVDISLPSSACSHLSSAFLFASSLSSFLLPFFPLLQALSISPLPGQFVFCFEPSSVLPLVPSFSWPVTCWLAPAMCDAYRRVIWCCLFRGSTYLYLTAEMIAVILLLLGNEKWREAECEVLGEG